MTIFLYRAANAEQFIVESTSVLERLLKGGGISMDDYCFFEGAQDWVPLRNIQICGNRIAVVSSVPSTTPIRELSSAGHHRHHLDLDLTLKTHNNGLAYVAFTLGCLSFLFSALAAIPGLICGHIAMKQCDGDPTLLGRGWAKTGVILCWVVIIANLLVAGLFALWLSYTLSRS